MTNLQAVRALQRILLRLGQINFDLDVFELKGDNTMADTVSPAVAALIAEFDVATTAIANRIATLVANANPALSAADTAAFQAEVDKLTAMGKDGTTPGPTPVP